MLGQVIAKNHHRRWLHVRERFFELAVALPQRQLPQVEDLARIPFHQGQVPILLGDFTDLVKPPFIAVKLGIEEQDLSARDTAAQLPKDGGTVLYGMRVKEEELSRHDWHKFIMSKRCRHVLGRRYRLGFMHPIELGNWVLIALGVCMALGGPWLLYRTIRSEIDARKAQPGVQPQWINSGINVLIALALLFAGVLFVTNNLRGNPLASLNSSTIVAVVGTFGGERSCSLA
jgi:hypothetical protein